MKKLLIICIIALVSVSCNNDLYKYYDYDNLIFSYGKRDIPDKEIKKLVKQYDKIVSQPKGKRKLPAPGVCADYGYLLFRIGKKDEARDMFRKEVVLYPESEVFINKLIEELGL